MNKEIIINDPKEAVLVKELEQRTDIKAERIKRLLALPDLTKKENSPVKILFDQILTLPRFKDFDIVDFPKILTVEQNFDLLNTPKDHPSRSQTDTYYLDATHVLRTHTTAFWAFYLSDTEVLKKLETEGHIGAISKGIVFRKDEIDRSHGPAFHQFDGLYICKKSQKIIDQEELQAAQIDLAQGIFGKDIEYKFLEDSFPFTVESLEMDIKFKGEWLEVNGAGLVNPVVLKSFGLDPEIYNGASVFNVIPILVNW